MDYKKLQQEAFEHNKCDKIHSTEYNYSVPRNKFVDLVNYSAQLPGICHQSLELLNIVIEEIDALEEYDLQGEEVQHFMHCIKIIENLVGKCDNNKLNLLICKAIGISNAIKSLLLSQCITEKKMKTPESKNNAPLIKILTVLDFFYARQLFGL